LKRTGRQGRARAMFTFLLIVHAMIAGSLVIVILMQRSEGGGLGMGGSPSGLMSARGAADFLTRATAVLATMFVLSSIFLAVLATVSRAPTKIDTSLVRPTAPGSTAPLGGQQAPLPGQPISPLGGTTTDPLAGIAVNATAPVSNDAAPSGR
jgi:preprotein translocase subunit SecG